MRWPLGLALLPALFLLREARMAPPPAPAAKPAPPAELSRYLIPDSLIPPPITGGSPEPPALLPPAGSCRDAAPYYDSADRLPGQVNGKLVKGAEGLRRLRRAWGDSLIVLRNGDFAGADLRGIRLHNICFVETHFAGSDWSGARAPGIGFITADLTGAKLRRARMPQLRIHNPYLARVDATGADFSDGILSGNGLGSWEGLRLDGADLSRFSFRCRPVQGEQCVANQSAPAISFRGANLRDAKVDTYPGEADWTGARLSRTQVGLWQLLELAPARIAGPLILREAEAKGILAPAEYRWLHRHISRHEWPEKPLKGARPAWMKPGAQALFATAPIKFDPIARASPIYRRILPVLVEGAWSVLLVKVRRNGRIDIAGGAVGGNAHSCSLGGRNLRLEGSTGWFVGEDQGDGSFGARPPERPMPLVAFSGEQAEVYEGGDPPSELDWGFSHFGLCGARARFERMIRLPLSGDQAKRLYDTWD
jgi:hypothetical protein